MCVFFWYISGYSEWHCYVDLSSGAMNSGNFLRLSYEPGDGTHIDEVLLLTGTSAVPLRYMYQLMRNVNCSARRTS